MPPDENPLKPVIQPPLYEPLATPFTGGFVMGLTVVHDAAPTKGQLKVVCAGSGYPVVTPVSASGGPYSWCGVCGAVADGFGQVMPTHLEGQPPAPPRQ